MLDVVALLHMTQIDKLTKSLILFKCVCVFYKYTHSLNTRK